MGVSDLTSCVVKARRGRFSCGGAMAAFRSSSQHAHERSSLTDSVPQRYPSCAASCRGWSMRSCEGSCAGGTETRSCRSGSGRSCCHHGCRACPVYAVSTPFISSCALPSCCPFIACVRYVRALRAGAVREFDMGRGRQLGRAARRTLPG